MSNPSADNSSLLIAAALRRRVLALCLAHAPALLLLLGGAGWWALSWLLVLHAVLLWGTLNPRSALFGPVWCRYSPHARSVWLTIDDGPSADTLAILQLLQQYQARATFFLVAERAQRQPGLVKALVAAGHEVGNHSNSHPAARFWCLPPLRMASEIAVAQRVLNELSGRPVRWFRAVVGHANPFVEPVLRVLGLRRVAWSARAYDAVDGNVDRVVERLLRGIEPGAIVLLHEGAAHGRSVDIIRGLLQALHARDYQAGLPS